MKSTGEVLGIGKTMPEALFKGLTAAGFKVPSPRSHKKPGVLISVEESDYQEIISLAKRFYDLGIALYATTGTAQAISTLGIDVISVKNAGESDDIPHLMAEGDLSYIVYTGAVKDATIGDYTVLHRKAMLLGIPCLTSLDTGHHFPDRGPAALGRHLRRNDTQGGLLHTGDQRGRKAGCHHGRARAPCGAYGTIDRRRRRNDGKRRRIYL